MYLLFTIVCIVFLCIIGIINNKIKTLCSSIMELNNKVDIITEKINNVESDVNTKFDSIQKNMDDVDPVMTTRFDKMKKHLENVNNDGDDIMITKFDTMTWKINDYRSAMTTKIKEVEGKISIINLSVNKIIVILIGCIHDIKCSSGFENTVNIINHGYVTLIVVIEMLQDLDLYGLCVPYVELLLDTGSDINEVDADDATPLMMAIETNNYKIIKLLLDRGANINMAKEHGITALMMAMDEDIIYSNNQMYLTVKLLLDRGANINMVNEGGETALILSVMLNHNEIVDLLLDAGADKNIKDNNGKAALDYAIRGNAVAVSLLK